jgi:hypothetical protein
MDVPRLQEIFRFSKFCILVIHLRNLFTKPLCLQLFEGDNEMERKSKDDGHGHGRITINVGGIRHETYLTTLRNHPDTR